MGVVRFLKERNPDVEVWAVEPPAGEMVDGLRNLDDGYIPPVFEKWGGPDLLDRKLIVRPRDSIHWVRRLVDEVGVFAGISSGAVMAGAAKAAERIDGAGVVVTVFPDAGWKYLSSGAWTDDLDQVEERARRINYW